MTTNVMRYHQMRRFKMFQRMSGMQLELRTMTAISGCAHHAFVREILLTNTSLNKLFLLLLLLVWKRQRN